MRVDQLQKGREDKQKDSYDNKSIIFVHNIRTYNKQKAFKLGDKAVNLLSNIQDVHLFNLTELEFFYDDLVFSVMKKSDIENFGKLNADTVCDNLVEPTIDL